MPLCADGRLFVASLAAGLLAAALCCAADDGLIAPERATIWVVCEPVHTRDHLRLALSFEPDVILRAWFKWGWTPDFSGYADRALEAARRGALFGGGVTCAAIERGEMNLPDAAFERLVARGPDGRPVPFGPEEGPVYRGAIESSEYLDYVLSWALKQVDAGATTLLLDGPGAASSERTGFTEAGIAGFRAHLLEKYVEKGGWAPDDSRWAERFGIALGDRREAPDGTMRSFDYRAYLVRQGFAKQPLAPENRLAVEWGAPGDLAEQTWCGRRNLAAWRTLVEGIRTYARQRQRPVYVASLGVLPLVDYHVVPVGDCWPLRDGGITAEASYVSRWRDLIEQSRAALGRDAPLVVFLEWGQEIPWESVGVEDRILWLRRYAPEVFASGAFFAWPVSGCGGKSLASENGTFELIAGLTRWYRRHARLYHDVRWLGEGLVRTEPDIVTTMMDQTTDGARRIVHVINKRFGPNKQPQPRRSLRLEIPSGVAPQTAVAFSPDDDRATPLAVRHAGETATIELEQLVAYSVVTLEYGRPPDDDYVIIGDVHIAPDRRWDVDGGTEFVIARDRVVRSEPAGAPLSAFLHGAFRKERRRTPVFRGEFAEGAAVRLTVNSVARLGARIVIRVDGQAALEENLPDRDGLDDSAAGEYAREIAVKIPPGIRAITLENAGGDWLTLDRVVFERVRGLRTTRTAGAATSTH